MIGVYLAAPLAMRVRTSSLGRALRRRGLEVVSTWHDESGPEVDPEDQLTRKRLARRCFVEVQRADVLVFDARGDARSRMGLVELGIALGSCADVACLVDDGPRVDMGIASSLPVEIRAPLVFGPASAAEDIEAWCRSRGMP